MAYPVANLATAITRIGEALDLRAVLVERYGVALTPNGERWCGPCLLPSTVESFAGSCSEQDASERGGGEAPSNLSVSVGERTLVFRCHSCGRHGDVIDLIGYADGVARGEGGRVGLGAVRRAAELCGLGWMLDGVSGPRVGRDKTDLSLALAEPVATALRSIAPVNVDLARKLNEFARKTWSANLAESTPEAEAARATLLARGVSIEQAKRHGIGFAPSGNQLARKIQSLAVKGATSEVSLIDLACSIGLVKRSTKGEGWYDAQRDRLVFPYCEPTPSKLIVTGFAGRSLADPLPNEVPKWLNSPTTPGLWSKKSALLGLASALRLSANDSRRRCVVVEGGLDMLALERAEIPAVSPVGVDFTLQHATVLQRLGFVSVTVMFDGDEGGRSATPGALAALLAAGYEYADVHVIDLADRLDPDDLSVDDLQRAYDCPLSIAEYLVGRSSFFREHSDRVLPLLTYVPDEVRVELTIALEIDAVRIRERPAIGTDATPGQRVVRAVLAHASECAFLSIAEVEAALAPEPHLLPLLRAVTFGEATDVARLPKALLCVLALARYTQAKETTDADALLDLWRYGESIDAYRRALNERTALHDRLRACKKELDRLDVPTR